MEVKATQLVMLNGKKFEMTEDAERVYFKEVSDRKYKSNFSLSKKKGDGDNAKYGLTVFWTEVFS